MKNGFEDLEVWKKSHELTLKIYNITETFPEKEKFRLTSQLCRSVSSVPANIVEGRGRYHRNEFRQFLYIARGSLEETKYHLILAKDLKYIDELVYNELMDLAIHTGKLLNGLIKSL